MTYREAIKKLLELIQDIEWRGTKDGGYTSVCPLCGAEAPWNYPDPENWNHASACPIRKEREAVLNGIGGIPIDYEPLRVEYTPTVPNTVYKNLRLCAMAGCRRQRVDGKDLCKHHWDMEHNTFPES